MWCLHCQLEIFLERRRRVTPHCFWNISIYTTPTPLWKGGETNISQQNVCNVGNSHIQKPWIQRAPGGVRLEKIPARRPSVVPQWRILAALWILMWVCLALWNFISSDHSIISFIKPISSNHSLLLNTIIPPIYSHKLGGVEIATRDGCSFCLFFS